MSGHRENPEENEDRTATFYFFNERIDNVDLTLSNIQDGLGCSIDGEITKTFIDLLRLATPRGFIQWKRDANGSGNKYYMYMAHLNGTTFDKGTPLDFNMTPEESNWYQDRINYIMLSTANPEYNNHPMYMDPLPIELVNYRLRF